MTSSEASVPAGAAKAPSTTSTRLFVRQTSGLVRDLGIPAATGISLASVAIVNTFINFNAGLTDFAKADMYLPLVAAAIIWLVAMFAYRYLLRAVPRAGGEYVYLSRIVSPAAGSVAGLGIAVVFTYVLSTNAHFAAQFTPFMLSGLGSAFHSTALANAGTHLTSNIAIAWLSVAVMLIVAALSLFSVRIVARIIFWLIVLQVVAFLVLIGMLAANSHADFTSALASYSHNPNAFAAIISAAKSTGVVFGTLDRGRGGDHPVHGAELQRRAVLLLRRRRAAPTGKDQLVRLHDQHRRARGAVGRRLGATARPRRTAVHAGAGQPQRGQPHRLRQDHQPELGGGRPWLRHDHRPSDPITKILFATAVPLAEIAVNLAFLTVTTRVLFAQAFDRLLPVRVAKIGDRNHAPNVAIAIVLVIGIGFCFLTSLVNLGSIVALQSLFFALILLAGGIAATALPLRRSDLIETPGMAEDARRRWLRNVTLVGAATTILALFTVYELVAHSSVYGKFSWESILTLVIVLGAGPVIYLIARTVRRQRNALDLSMAMRELPPE